MAYPRDVQRFAQQQQQQQQQQQIRKSSLQSQSEKSPFYDPLPMPATSPKTIRGRCFLRVMLYALLFGVVTVGMHSYYCTPAPFNPDEVLALPNVGLHHAKLLDYKQLEEIPEKYIPRENDAKEKRLVFIGDVHGMYKELRDLLHEIHYNSKTDHLVFTGDMVSKGPESLKVIDFARKEEASCVRGNHDDRILLHYHRIHARAGTEEEEKEDEPPVKGMKKVRKEKKLARKMSKKQAEYLDSCPLILKASGVMGLGNVAVVHAGLVQGIELENQDPFALMNMRSIHSKLRVPSDDTDGMHWAKLWNRFEAKAKEQKTVIYGHYAARGLDIRPLSKGLDTNCVRGGKLTAFVVSSSSKDPKIVSVNCREEYSG
ncbi:Similar to Bis(5'-nucleosyl)-tetraphosphatase; acc. no. B2VGQ8 [Pyronema omphalodes CBS 100304]|uniref:Similar to Bis(5'-nucleosyl)-tetraphosphatase acc. no. B2VGQ8 n=1 Tax=Pyronema omphalodes (strain CBS 100304) TaxID=1076935 RepID=U4KW07_PYROM|nr:Similar to Bis(5'-nucleosyl)-tetraphosphatase; acc. no. B2VGQ8 [Pyronema omphalodes CBS 100304]